MGKTVEVSEQERQTGEVLRDLEVLPAGHKLSADELMAFIRRMPRLDLPEDWTSADDIREFRGPLPEDDPEYQRNIRGRR